MEQNTIRKIPRFARILLAIVALATLVFGGMAFTSTISQLQTDDIKPQKPDMPLFGRFPGFDQHGRFGGDIDYDALLADALGITVEELQSGREKADLAALEEAVAKGYITEEQASLMKARAALEKYIDRNELTAKALGITVEDLESALQNAKTFKDLLDESGLDAETFHTNLQAAYKEAIQQAVTDSVITQDQADLLLEQELNGPMFGGGMHGFRRPPMGDGPMNPDQNQNLEDGT